MGVLIPNHHEGYLSWADHERNLDLIADNANGKTPMSRGALRRGEALLAGLLRCGHCGRKLHVAYSGKDGNTGRYHCRGGANKDVLGRVPAWHPRRASGSCER